MTPVRGGEAGSGRSSGAGAGSGPSTGTSRRNVLRTFQASAAAATAAYLVNLAILPTILDRLGSERYGAWVTVASLLAIGGLADAGIRTEVIRRVAAAKGDNDDARLVASVHQGLTLAVVMGTVLLALGLVGAPAVRSFAFPSGVAGMSNPAVDMLVRATTGLLFLTITANAYFGALRGVQRGDIESLAHMASVPFGAIVTVLAVVGGWGLWGLLAGGAVQLATSVGWQALGAHKVVPGLHPRLARLPVSAARTFLGLSGLALLAQVGDVIDSQWDKIVISRYVGSAAVTAYQVGTGIVLQGKFVTLLLLAPLMAAVAEWSSNEPSRLAGLFDRLSRAAMVLAAVVLGGIAVFAPAFIGLWLPELDDSAGHAARLFVIAVAVNVAGAPWVLRALGEGWHRLVAAGALANMAVNTGLSLVLTMAYGFDGALYGSIAGNVVGTVAFLMFARHRSGDGWRIPPLAAPIVGVVAAVGAIALGLDDVGSWPGLVVASAAYAGVVGLAASAAQGLRPREVIGSAGTGVKR